MGRKEATREFVKVSNGKEARFVISASHETRKTVIYADGWNVETNSIEVIDRLEIKCYVDGKFIDSSIFVPRKIDADSKAAKAGAVATMGRISLRQDAYESMINAINEVQAEVRPAPAPRKKSAEEIKIEEAKETGKKVLICKFMADCNDSREECDYDTVYRYAMPDGRVVDERFHSW